MTSLLHICQNVAAINSITVLITPISFHLGLTCHPGGRDVHGVGRTAQASPASRSVCDVPVECARGCAQDVPHRLDGHDGRPGL